MNSEQIIKMAREAGLNVTFVGDPTGINYDIVERFFHMAQAAEREACAQIVEQSSLPDSYSEPALLVIAEDIRARGQS